MVTEQSIESQLEKISKHSLFIRSRRSVSFLSYICLNTVRGKEDHIKEYSIGVDAFGLDPSFDPQTDPRIRVEARRLRKKLEQYYQTDGTGDPILIHVPTGSYIPEISLKEEKQKQSREKSESFFGKDFLFINDGFLLRVEDPHPAENCRYCMGDYLHTSLSMILYKQSDNSKGPGKTAPDLKAFRVKLQYSDTKDSFAVHMKIGESEDQLVTKMKIDLNNSEGLPAVLDSLAEDAGAELIQFCRTMYSKADV